MKTLTTILLLTGLQVSALATTTLTCQLYYRGFSNELAEHFSHFSGPHTGNVTVEGPKRKFTFADDATHLFLGSVRLSDERTGFEYEGTVSNVFAPGNVKEATGLIGLNGTLRHPALRMAIRGLDTLDPKSPLLAGHSLTQDSLDLSVAGADIRVTAYSPYLGAKGEHLVVKVDRLTSASLSCVAGR